MGLFDGTPNVSSSQIMQTTEVPTWMQDAIYNQIQWSQNLANKDYQPYSPEPEFIEQEASKRIAGFSPTRTQAYANTVANQGSWSPAMAAAQSGMAGFTTKGTADDFRTAQADYLRKDMVDKGLNAGQDLYGRAAGMDIVGAAQPALNKALGMDAFSAGSPLINQAGAQNIVGAAQPYLSQAGTTTAQALADRALAAANPYLQASAQTAPSQISNYMSPYQGGVLDVLAKQGARQLNEQLLPAVSDQFIKAGQFGSSRMGEFGSRALRDMQEGVLNKQGDLLNQGYNQALVASQGDLNRQAQLASTAGSTSAADLSRILQAASQYGSLGQTAGGLTGQQMQYLANLGHTTGQLTGQQMQQLGTLGQMQTTAGQAQQQFGLGAAQQTQTARAQDYTRQMAALNQFQQMQAAEQGMRGADVAALETAGQAQQGQNQRGLDQAYQEFVEQQMYPRQQMDWLSTQVRGLSPITPQTVSQQGQSIGASYSPSPLSQLASGVFAGKGLQSLWG